MRDDRYYIQHGDNTPLMYHAKLIFRLNTIYNMVYLIHVVIIYMAWQSFLDEATSLQAPA